MSLDKLVISKFKLKLKNNNFDDTIKFIQEKAEISILNENDKEINFNYFNYFSSEFPFPALFKARLRLDKNKKSEITILLVKDPYYNNAFYLPILIAIATLLASKGILMMIITLTLGELFFITVYNIKAFVLIFKIRLKLWEL